MTAPAAPAADSAAGELRARLLARIRDRGPLRFDEFMEQALYAPGLGYYERGEVVFGAGGDFVTAPGLGGLFARCLAEFCDRARAGGGGDAIAEYGPGDGRLAADLMDALGEPPARYVLLERAAGLRARQRRELAARTPPAAWSPVLPDGFAGVVIANEFLDAHPARCYEVVGGGVRERVVGAADGVLAWELAEAPDLAAAAAAAHAGAGGLPAPGYRSELRPDAHRGWLEEVAGRLRRGFVVLIDYGYPRREYYHPERRAGTLRAHAGQRVAPDPLAAAGRQDLSVDVDFTAAAETAAALGLEVLLFTTQAGFLLEYGVLEHAAGAGDERGRLARRGELETLLHPERMGERFRALVLGRGVELELPRGVCPDHRNRL